MEKALSLELGFMNNEDMGKGKTITTIFTANQLQKDRNYNSVVIVCPANVVKVWEDNKKHFNTKDISIYSYNKIAVSDVVFNCDILILDESHKLKNHRSKTGKRLRESNWKYCFCLTGTPMEKAYLDLWSQIRYIDPYLLGDYFSFLRRYCITNHYNVVVNYKNTQELLSKLKEYMFISDIAEVKNYKVSVKKVSYQLAKANKDIIHEIQTNMELLSPEYVFITTSASKQRIIQHCACGKYTSNPDLIKKLKAIVKKHSDVIILYNFNCELEILKKEFCNAKQYNSHKKEREEYIAEGGVLLAQIASIGEGTDGLQHISSCIVFSSLNWSYRLNAQAKKRVDRIGQVNDCHIYYMVNETEIDKLILSALKQKKSLSTKTLKVIKEE